MYESDNDSAALSVVGSVASVVLHVVWMVAKAFLAALLLVMHLTFENL